MMRGEASALLGCAVGSDAETVRTAFAHKVKANHPDTAPGGVVLDLATLKKARDVLLTAAGEVRPSTCPHCRGSGWIQVGFKQERCVRGC